MGSDGGDTYSSGGSAWKQGMSKKRDDAGKSTGRVIRAGSAGKVSSSRGSSSRGAFSYFGDEASSSFSLGRSKQDKKHSTWTR